MSLARFWEHVGRHGGIDLVHQQLAELIDAEAIDALVRARLLRRTSLALDDEYICQAPASETCARHVAERADGTWVGRCSLRPPECAEEVLTPRIRFRYTASRQDLFAALARLLVVAEQLQLTAGAREPLWLGSRELGDEQWHFHLVLQPLRMRLDMLDQLAEHSAQGCRDVMLVPGLHLVPPAVVRHKRRAGMDWLDLGATCLVSDQVRVDLSRLLLQWRPKRAKIAELLWPRYLLVHDRETGEFRFGGQRLSIVVGVQAGRFLARLMRSPGLLVSRGDMARLVFPEDFQKDGRWSRGVKPTTLYERLRDVRGDVRAALREAAQRTGLPEPQIEVDERKGENGGDILRLDVDQVCIVDPHGSGTDSSAT